MVTGRLLNRLLPRRITFTHCGVNQAALAVLRQQAPEVVFPSIDQINAHEGFRGPDGLWLLSGQPTSFSVYNPHTQMGQGIETVWHHCDRLRQHAALAEMDQMAQEAAYLSHILTDICTPPHQHGEPAPLKQQRLLFWKVRNDWREHLTPHMWFEWLSAVHLKLSPRYPIRLNRRLLKQLKRVQYRALDFKRTWHGRLLWLRHRRVFERYLQYGWTRQVTQEMEQVIMPKIVSLVATTWYFAASTHQAGRTAP